MSNDNQDNQKQPSIKQYITQITGYKLKIPIKWFYELKITSCCNRQPLVRRHFEYVTILNHCIGLNLWTFLRLRNLIGGKHADKRRGWGSRSHHFSVPEGQLWPLGDPGTIKTSTLPQQHRTGSRQRCKTNGHVSALDTSKTISQWMWRKGFLIFYIIRLTK